MRSLIIFAAFGLLAEDLPESKPVPVELTNTFFWADSQLLRAQAAVTAAAKDRDAAVVAMAEFCGEKFTPSISPADQKRLVCVKK